MNWQDSTVWWLIALALVGVELTTGTFYLLMLALGAAAAALSAHAGAQTVTQMLLAAVVGATAVSLWHWRRVSRDRRPPAAADPAINLDIGSRVQVLQWDSAGPGATARVQYRGASWQARHVGVAAPQPGEHEICGVEGSCLLLQPLPRGQEGH